MKTHTDIIKEEDLKKEVGTNRKSRKQKTKKPMTLEQQIIQQRCILKAVKAKLQGLINEKLVRQIQSLKAEQSKDEGGGK